jgi:hypothetical protein
MSLSKFTDIIVLLDRSSSMRKIADATRSSFNEFLDSQKQLRGEARLTLATFSDPTDFNYLYINTPLQSVEGLTLVNYRPDGFSTALRDALGRLIDGVGARYASVPEASRPEKVVFVVVTDGEENASTRFSVKDIQDRVTRQQDVYKWQFVFLGANQDAILVAQEYSMPMAAAMTYSYSEQGIGTTSRILGDKIGTLRSSNVGTYSVNFDDKDRAEALKQDKGK